MRSFVKIITARTGTEDSTEDAQAVLPQKLNKRESSSGSGKMGKLLKRGYTPHFRVGPLNNNFFG